MDISSTSQSLSILKTTSSAELQNYIQRDKIKNWDRSEKLILIVKRNIIKEAHRADKLICQYTKLGSNDHVTGLTNL